MANNCISNSEIQLAELILKEFVGKSAQWGGGSIARRVNDKVREMTGRQYESEFTYDYAGPHNQYTMTLYYRKFPYVQIEAKRKVTKPGTRYSMQEYAYKDISFHFYYGDKHSLEELMDALDAQADANDKRKADELEYMKGIMQQIMRERNIREWDARYFLEKMYKNRYNIV